MEDKWEWLKWVVFYTVATYLLMVILFSHPIY